MLAQVSAESLPDVVMPACPVRKVLKGQRALVTGGNSGIGKGIAIALAHAGADVVINYRSGEDAARQVADEAARCGSRVMIHQADVSQEEQVQAMFRRAIAELGTIDITVGDMDGSLVFYRDVLTFEKQSDELLESEDVVENGVRSGRVRRVRLKLGDESIVLTQFLEPKGRPIPVDSRSNDRWFQHIAVITGDMDRAYQRLLEHKVAGISPAPQRLPDWNRAAGGIRAYYFRDPDGHPLEVLQFPRDKGQRKWHQSSERLFLGIDHTAIVVADTERSLEFYRDLLGMKVVGEYMNSGPEQERVNDVPRARLRITSLRAASGPGVELLEYLHPTDGRESATDTHAADLVHWQTIMSTASFPEAVARLRASKANVALRSRQGISLLDPDRHAILFQPANGHHSDLRGRNP